jgi:hypothetical protein
MAARKPTSKRATTRMCARCKNPVFEQLYEDRQGRPLHHWCWMREPYLRPGDGK